MRLGSRSIQHPTLGWRWTRGSGRASRELQSALNTSSFETEARLTLWLMWDGKPLPNSECMPKMTFIQRDIAMGPQPFTFWMRSSCTLPAEAAYQWESEKALISAAASATYADRDAATEYDFTGSVRRKQSFVDVELSNWFRRPREAAPQ